MPVEKVPGRNCYKVHNTTTKKCLTRDAATNQLRAIEANKHRHESIYYKGFLYEAESEYLDLADELESGTVIDIESLLNKWMNDGLAPFNWSKPRDHYVLRYTRSDEYKVIVGNELVDISDLIERPYLYHKELPKFADFDKSINELFWRSPELLYHATDCKNIDSILKHGLNASWGTGISNRSSHGVFVSTEPDGYIDSYGECKLIIDMPQMKRDNDMIIVNLEPEVERYQLANAIYSYFGIELEYEISSGSGEDFNTYIIQGEVKPRYIRKYEQ